jgi:hypothetical protein
VRIGRKKFPLLSRHREKEKENCECDEIKENSSSLIFISFYAHSTGNGLIDETEFLQWIGRIQALRENPTTSSTADDDDLTQDLVAAFRLEN